VTSFQEIGKGYGFAYFAWMRLAPFSSYRAQSAEKGLTFFLMFEAIQNGAFRSGEH
jgi:uncharacterized membrane protein YdjX (TVP38/TMEM64 family)